ncbi:MAG: tetratricopeptide repeat protein [Solirubrobacterales bacterium]|nr:tetratricopeptide repeat protein [Solirubrobacterales bacterium]
MSDPPTHFDLPEAVTSDPLHLTVDPWWDSMHCLAFGTVSDGIADGQRLVADSGQLAFVVADPEAGPVLGFEIIDMSEFELPEEDPELWDGPRFTVPRLGLVDASAGEIVLAVRAQVGDDPTADALHFHTAINAESAEAALPHWELALDAGDMRAHFGLGYTLVDVGRPDRAYAHLRRYTELVPANSWAWCWLGQCCEALGRDSEARTAYERGFAVEALCGMETDCAQRLERLRG